MRTPPIEPRTGIRQFVTRKGGKDGFSVDVLKLARRGAADRSQRDPGNPLCPLLGLGRGSLLADSALPLVRRSLGIEGRRLRGYEA